MPVIVVEAGAGFGVSWVILRFSSKSQKDSGRRLDNQYRMIAAWSLNMIYFVNCRGCFEFAVVVFGGSAVGDVRRVSFAPVVHVMTSSRSTGNG